MSFRKYVKNRKVTNDPAGDFAGDVQGDDKFPDVKSWREVSGYLWSRGADLAVMEIAKEVWDEYEISRMLA